MKHGRSNRELARILLHEKPLFADCQMLFDILWPPRCQLASRRTGKHIQNLESGKSITSCSSNERQGTVRLKSQPGLPLTGSITKGKGNHTAYLIHQKSPFEMGCWVASSLANMAGIDGAAPGCEDAWPERGGPGHVSMGTGPSAGSS